VRQAPTFRISEHPQAPSEPVSLSELEDWIVAELYQPRNVAVSWCANLQRRGALRLPGLFRAVYTGRTPPDLPEP
jgi:hypothetical protein